MKKLLALLLALVMVLSFAACNNGGDVESKPDDSQSQPEESQGQEEEPFVAVHAERDDWADDVKAAINALVDTYGKASATYADPYVVFDFDNTCSIFDVEEQLAIHQLNTMTFAIAPEELTAVLEEGLGDLEEVRDDAKAYSVKEKAVSYSAVVEDIVKAYTYLWKTYGPFTAAGLDEAKQAEVQADPQWLEFATKMRVMYSFVGDAESADVAYPWILYWFTGMTEQEVYDLAYASHTKYSAVETREDTWTSPEIESKAGQMTVTYYMGTTVSENIKELWKVLDSNGIDVWVCSASATDPIRAAIDAWDLHPYCTGMLAMTNVVEDGKYVHKYDYENGCGWLANEDGTWTRDTLPTKAQTQGVGKTTAIVNAILPKYSNHGPVAGFMDSTGDFNFCTEFETLRLVICFNRANRKLKDGGGLVAAMSKYERDVLGYDFAKADAAGDTLYVLQGREENGLRGFRNSNATMRLGKSEEQLFADQESFDAIIKYWTDNNMSVKDAFDAFAFKTAKDAEGNLIGFQYGCLKAYDGYHYHP